MVFRKSYIVQRFKTIVPFSQNQILGPSLKYLPLSVLFKYRHPIIEMIPACMRWNSQRNSDNERCWSVFKWKWWWLSRRNHCPEYFCIYACPLKFRMINWIGWGWRCLSSQSIYCCCFYYVGVPCDQLLSISKLFSVRSQNFHSIRVVVVEDYDFIVSAVGKHFHCFSFLKGSSHGQTADRVGG